MFGKVKLWWRIIRPHTLFAAVAPVLTALFVVAMQSPERLHIPVALLTLLCATALQVFANLVNDYCDYQKGADKKGRVGFRRALAEGEVTLSEMRTALIVTLSVIAFTGGLLVLRGALPILAIGLTALLFAWLYTATRYSLAYLGIADLFVFLYFGIVATTGTAYLQTHQWSLTACLAGGVNGVISMCVLCINNLRDIDDDRLVGKRTLPVRFGPQAAYIELMLCALLSLLFAYAAFGLSLPCFIVLSMAYLVVRTLRAHGAQYNPCLVLAGWVNMLYTLLVLLTCLLSL